MTKLTKEAQEIRELREHIRRLEDMIETLSVDPSYGITTRPALEFELRPVERLARYVVFMDIDGLHNLNESLPGKHEEANKKIQRALHVRAEDVLVRGRWYSGDELIFILSGDPSSFCARLLEAFKREGMSFTYSFVPYSGKIGEDVDRAKEVVDRLKSSRGPSR